MTKQLSDAEIRARLETAQAQLADAIDPDRRRFLQRRVASYKMHLVLGTAGRTAAREKANETTHSGKTPPRFSNRGARNNAAPRLIRQ
jgi:hypothetical protein